MYNIIGSDQKVYGPVSLEQIRQWEAEGRVDGETLLQSEGSKEWKPLSSVPGLGVPPPVTMPHPSLQQRNGMATAGLVFGVLSNLCAFGSVFPALGIIFSAIGLSRHDPRYHSSGRTLAIAGLVLSIIAIAWRGLFPFFWFHHHWRRW